MTLAGLSADAEVSATTRGSPVSLDTRNKCQFSRFLPDFCVFSLSRLPLTEPVPRSVPEMPRGKGCWVSSRSTAPRAEGFRRWPGLLSAGRTWTHSGPGIILDLQHTHRPPRGAPGHTESTKDVQERQRRPNADCVSVAGTRVSFALLYPFLGGIKVGKLCQGGFVVVAVGFFLRLSQRVLKMSNEQV